MKKRNRDHIIQNDIIHHFIKGYSLLPALSSTHENKNKSRKKMGKYMEEDGITVILLAVTIS